MRDDVLTIYDTTRLRLNRFVIPYEKMLVEACENYVRSGRRTSKEADEINYYATMLAKVSSIVSAYELNRIADFEINDKEPVAVPDDITFSDVLSESKDIGAIRQIDFKPLLATDLVCANIADCNLRTVMLTYIALRDNVYDQTEAISTHWKRSHLWGYRYTAILDEKVRPTHKRQHGVTAPWNSRFWDKWYPPNGYNCRCRCYPVYRKPKYIVNPARSCKVDSGFEFNPAKVQIVSGQYRIEDMVR